MEYIRKCAGKRSGSSKDGAIITIANETYSLEPACDMGVICAGKTTRKRLTILGQNIYTKRPIGMNSPTHSAVRSKAQKEAWRVGGDRCKCAYGSTLQPARPVRRHDGNAGRYSAHCANEIMPFDHPMLLEFRNSKPKKYFQCDHSTKPTI